MIGKTVSHYRIIDEIGAGGMGVVYKAEDTKLKRTVALKFLPERSLSSEKELIRFTREAQAAAALDHPNICAVHEIEEADGRTFISMAFCEGKNLRDLITERSLDLEESVEIVTQVAEGLTAAHGKGIIHRDIKPANIMIDESLHAKIMDFGLAKLADRTALTRTGAAVGTVSYMSPEQVRGEETDARSDVWSLGTVLYELVTGRHPFEGEYDAAIIYSILQLNPPPIDELDPAVPSDLAAVVERCLEKKPEARYQSMGEMLEDLHKVQHILAKTAEPSEHVRRFTRRKRLMRAAAISSAVLIALVVLYLVIDGDIEPISVMVVDIDNKTGDPGLSVLTEFFDMELAQTSHINTMSRGRFNDLIGKSGADSLDDAAYFAVAKSAGVQTVLFPAIFRIGDTFVINARIHDPVSGELLFAKNVKGSGIEALTGLMDELYSMVKSEFRKLHLIPRIEDEPSLPLQQLATTPSVEAYVDYYKGENLYNSGRQLEAIPCLERAIEIDSTFVKALRRLALLYDYNGDTEKALSFAMKAREYSTGMGEREYVISMITEQIILKNWDRAIELMRVLLDGNQNDIVTRHQLGYYLARYKKSYDEAIEQYEKALALDPKNLSGRRGSLYNSLGNAYLFSWRIEKAMEAFEMYREHAPNAPDPLHSIAYALMYSGQYEQAIELYKKIIDIDPDFYIVYRDIGSAYLACGKWREAISSFERYLEHAPETARAKGWADIADVHATQDDLHRAEAAIGKALELDSYCPEARRLEGLIALRDHNDRDTALLALEAIGKGEVPTSYTLAAAAYQNLNGWILIESGDREGGIKYIQQAIKLAPNEYIYFERDLVRAYIAMDDFESAIDRGNRILELNPNDGELLAMMSEAYEAAGELEIAESYRKRALTVWEHADLDFCPREQIEAQSSQRI